ncbi:bifunctional lytic transglycosylase/C40 family peptidase [Kibdelosporangium persicum]|uniref:Secreted transglycosylase n=1 Tax=Kibdelosporangium persicum TaxID=2698649 RepID=A0ABX2F3Q2_9PSEU|nr:bifunctional lytic transglycosylase/C40 family peptidase [Kibdelosporangium persicum]NRN65823.1 Secreted transglycosylase [Kibdelosporangium persicum]
MSTSTKIAVGAAAAVLLLPVLLAAAAGSVISAVFGRGTSTPSQTAIADIPADYLTLYQQAATECLGLDWSILAAIGKIESNHGRSTSVGVVDGTSNYAGARGPMQFLQSTFDSVITRHTIPPGGKSPPSPWDKHDAIFAASFYLCDNNAGHGLRAAIFAYNHADWYVDKVPTQATLYRGAPPDDSPARQAALAAVAFAQAQLGKPYVWGGDGDSEGGFDCSGLTHAAYHAAGVTIPRTAQTQHNAGPLLPRGTPLLPGDLVFFSSRPGKITHVGIAISSTHMINAPYTGAVIRIDPIGRYLAATRPSQGPAA